CAPCQAVEPANASCVMRHLDREYPRSAKRGTIRVLAAVLERTNPSSELRQHRREALAQCNVDELAVHVKALACIAHVQRWTRKHERSCGHQSLSGRDLCQTSTPPT